jgi:hypothetical protein
MTLPSSSSPYLGQAFIQVMGQSAGIKAQAIAALGQLQSGNVDANWIFNAVDIMRDAITRFNLYKNVAGLNAYATAQVSGYAGTMTTDITTTIAAIQDCMDWIVANFPKDTTAVYILAFTMAADGSRTPRLFTPAQTAGLQTKLQTLIATIG